MEIMCTVITVPGVRIPFSPPYSLYSNPILYEKGSGTFLFIGSSAACVRVTVDKQKQGGDHLESLRSVYARTQQNGQVLGI